MLGTVTAAVRGMTRTESVKTLLIWQLATVLVFHSLLLVFGVKWPTPRDLSLFVMCGLANLVGQVFWTKALMLAPATAVSPFFYFMLVWAAAIGFFVWDKVPTTALLAGSCIVVASGLFLLWHEAQAKKASDRLTPGRFPLFGIRSTLASEGSGGKALTDRCSTNFPISEAGAGLPNK